MKDRLIFHIDVNSAFLSWESVYRLSLDPNALDLRTIPSAVGIQPSRHYPGQIHSSQEVRRGYWRTPDPGAEKMPSADCGAFPL